MSVSALLTISYVGLIIRFDGSLRYPSDPGFPVDSLGRMAVCAAAIVDQDDSSQNVNERIALVGGKLLNANSLWTSAQAEYEGLLLGLEGVSQLRQNQPSTCTTNMSISTTTTVTVQGDCKTVMEQMLGRSRSRKLESYYEKATNMLQEIPFDFEFQHIPRENNRFCDRLCAKIISEQEMDAFRMVQQDIKDIAEDVLTEIDAEGSGRQVESSRISELIVRHFDNFSSLITFSRRPALYREMACIAAAIRDSTGLTRIGEQLEKEVKTVWTSFQQSAVAHQSLALGSTEIAQDRNDKDRLLVEAIVYQMLGLRSLGGEKQASSLERKNRYVLKQFAEHANNVEEWLYEHDATRWPKASDSCNCDSYTDDSKLSEDDDLHAQLQRWHAAATLSSSWKDKGVFWLSCADTSFV